MLISTVNPVKIDGFPLTALTIWVEGFKGPLRSEQAVTNVLYKSLSIAVLHRWKAKETQN